MMITFIESTEKGLTDMKHAFKSGELQAITYLAHKLLPPCRHIGASDLYKVLVRIEETKDGKGNEALFESLILEAIKEFEQVRAQLQKEISKIR
jgi:uncharacterized FAD-dependent dehydrogenase